MKLDTLVTPGFVLRGLGTRERSEAAAGHVGRFVTISTCLAPGAPASWANPDWPMPDDERRAEAARAGCDAAQLAGLQSWVTAALASGALLPPDVFSDLAAARMFARHLPRDRPALQLLGIGLRPADAARYRDECAYPGSQPRLQPLPPGGEPLGWEPLSVYGCPHGHSWRCNAIDVEARVRLHILANAHGLVEDEADARRIAELCDSDEWPSEPEPWFAVAVVRYAIEP